MPVELAVSYSYASHSTSSSVQLLIFIEYFKEKIEDEVIRSESLFRFYFTWGIQWMTKIQNAEAALSYRMKFRPGCQDTNEEFPQLLEGMIQELLRFRTANDDRSSAAIHADYTANIVHMLAFNWLGNLSCYYIDKYCPEIESILKDKDFKAIDMLAPAVAVGDQKAIEHYLQNPNWWNCDGILGDVWRAAVSTGKPEIVRFLLGQLQSQAVLNLRELMPESIIFAYRLSVANHQVENAKLFIDFLGQSNYFNGYDGEDTIGIIMKSGSIELFEYLHRRFPDIKDWIDNYDDWLNIGFASACSKRHSDFVGFFLKSKDESYLRTVKEIYVTWYEWDWNTFHHVEDPVLLAAAKSNLSILDVLLEHDPTILGYENLLETAVLGFHYEEYLYPRDENSRIFWYERSSKKSSSHAVAQWLIDRGMPITRKTVNFINFLGRVIMSRPFLSDDFVMTLIMLLVNVKAHWNPRKLRKQIHVPVRKVLRRAIEEQSEMRMIGVQRYDFLASARELNAWLTGRR